MGDVFLPAEQESHGGDMSNHSSPVRSPTETDSPVAVKLSPLSLRSAAQAEREDIRRLKQECRGLSSVLKVSNLQQRYGNTIWQLLYFAWAATSIFCDENSPTLTTANCKYSR